MIPGRRLAAAADLESDAADRAVQARTGDREGVPVVPLRSGEPVARPDGEPDVIREMDDRVQPRLRDEKALPRENRLGERMSAWSQHLDGARGVGAAAAEQRVHAEAERAVAA